VVCLLVIFMSLAKTAEPIEMLFGRLTQVHARNHVLERREVQISQEEGAILGVGQHVVKH